MLAGVLHKELVPPNDQFPLVLSPHHTKCAPTDLHLREFAQLEVQVKALQIPAINSRTSAARLAECFHYYSRLFTVESFLWPDFLAVVFTKLAEHFAASENIIVQSAILRVFQRAKGHVAQVNDPSKVCITNGIIGLLRWILMPDAEAFRPFNGTFTARHRLYGTDNGAANTSYDAVAPSRKHNGATATYQGDKSYKLG
ncbi:hypothetical protein CCR75_002638 [Bremia lactucae]|uniref:Uncharacterized protein n=1 Tax=Bremia lactucae TaxID=4779 RepID=A0A976IBI0_BRELC|nr:hypothetical protein CCR75_002638 [Bremia lactucae]